MNLDTFFEHFETFADAPNAVERMREFILRLAVRGLLVSQSDCDEDAAKLVADTLRERNKLVDAKVVKGEILDTSFLKRRNGHLPPGWVHAPLAAYVAIVMGQSPPSAAYNKNGNGLPFYQGKAQFGTLSPIPTKWCTEPKKIAEPGDVLISVRAPVGPTNVATERSCIGRGLAALRGLGGDQRYLLYAIRAHEPNIASMGVGSTFVAISRRDLDSFEVPVPPLAEQKRIVAKVDELMALCDRLEEQQRERDAQHDRIVRAATARFNESPKPRNLNLLFHKSYQIPPAELRKTILNLAVRGRLVRRSNHQLHHGAPFGGTEVSEVAESDKRFSVPGSWQWILFKDVGEQRLGKMLDKAKNKGESKPYLRNTNVQWNRFELGDLKSMRIEPGEEDELRLKKGDLLICEGGEPGRCAIWNDELDEVYFQKALHRVRPREGILSEYLSLNLNLDAQNGVLAAYFTGATIKHLTGKSLAKYPIPLPPLAEQKRIVAKVDRLMALVDRLEADLVRSRAVSEELMDAVLSRVTTEP